MNMMMKYSASSMFKIFRMFLAHFSNSASFYSDKSTEHCILAEVILKQVMLKLLITLQWVGYRVVILIL